MTSCLHPLCDPERIIASTVFYNLIVLSVVLAEGERPVPSRTRKLSPPAPMVLHSLGCGRVGRRRHFFRRGRTRSFGAGLFGVPEPNAVTRGDGRAGGAGGPARSVSSTGEYRGWFRR